MMPTVPSATTHSRLSRNGRPGFTEKTSSPPSTKPPIAVRMPRKISTHFFIGQQRRLLLQAFLKTHQLREEARDPSLQIARGTRVAVSAAERVRLFAQTACQLERARRRLSHLRLELRGVELLARRLDVLPKLGRLRLEVTGSDLARLYLLGQQLTDGGLRPQLRNHVLQFLTVCRRFRRADDPRQRARQNRQKHGPLQPHAPRPHALVHGTLPVEPHTPGIGGHTPRSFKRAAFGAQTPRTLPHN